MSTNVVPDVSNAAPVNAPTWVLIVGVSVAVIAIIFMIYLVLSGKKLDKNARGLIAIITAFVGALAFGFIGGYAQARGELAISEKISPIQFGVGGGIAVFVIVFVLLWYTLVRESGPSKDNDGVISIGVPPETSLRAAIEAAAKAAEKIVIYDPDSEKYDKLMVKDGQVSAKSVQKAIELFPQRLIGGESFKYVVVVESDTNVIRIKT